MHVTQTLHQNKPEKSWSGSSNNERSWLISQGKQKKKYYHHCNTPIALISALKTRKYAFNPWYSHTHHPLTPGVFTCLQTRAEHLLFSVPPLLYPFFPPSGGPHPPFQPIICCYNFFYALILCCSYASLFCCFFYSKDFGTVAF